MKKLEALFDAVIVKPKEEEDTTYGSIVVPDMGKEKNQHAVVVAVGPGTKDEPLTVKVGDTVLYGKYAGTELKLEGTEYLMMRESDILAII